MKKAYVLFASLLIAALAPVGCLIGSAALVCLGGFLAVLALLAGAFCVICWPLLAARLYGELNTRLSRAKTSHKETPEQNEILATQERERIARETEAANERFHRGSAGRYVSNGAFEPFPETPAPNPGTPSSVRD